MNTARVYLATIVAASVAAQLWLAHRYFGFLTGDDVEVLSQGFAVATGYPFQAWNVRSLFIPDLVIAPAIWLAVHAGLADVRSIIFAVTLPMIAVSAGTILLVHRLAVRWGAGARGALVATVLFAFHWIPLGFGSTLYPRTIATASIVAAALLVTDGGAAGSAIAGLLVGIAFADRFSEIVFLAPLLLVARRRARFLTGSAVSILLVGGLFDWYTWGAPFWSFLNFAKLTLIKPDFASRVKFQPPWWYLGMLARWCALSLFPLFWYARREWRPFLCALIPFAALSLVLHKELRYLQGIIPFLAIAAGIGFARIPNRRLAAALVAIAIPWNLLEIKELRKKSMPAVSAAEMMRTNPAVHSVALSQAWPYGDRLFLRGKPAIELSDPLHDSRLRDVNAYAMFESDLDPEIATFLARQGFVRSARFADPPAREVLVFVRQP